MANRIVVKIGSSLLVDAASATAKKAWLAALAEDITSLRSTGKEIIIVSSGAIALGSGAMGLQSRPDKLEEAQAAAAVGQFRLAGAYETVFSLYDTIVAQLLLTLGDLESRARYLNARNTVETLLARNIIPIINENDTVATGEIRFGDNDRLAARVGHLCGADLVILLSDIDGLYTRDPRTTEEAELIPVVPELNADIMAMAGPAATKGTGTGGMVTKLMAASMATDGGCSVIICSGTGAHPLAKLSLKGVGTYFPAKSSPLAVRKRWIRGLMAPSGLLQLDSGAIEAIKKGASLLAAGVSVVEGKFDRGDLVTLMGADKQPFAQGIVSYNSQETDKICGRKMQEVAEILGYSGRSVLMHRDDLVLL